MMQRLHRHGETSRKLDVSRTSRDSANVSTKAKRDKFRSFYCRHRTCRGINENVPRLQSNATKTIQTFQTGCAHRVTLTSSAVLSPCEAMSSFFQQRVGSIQQPSVHAQSSFGQRPRRTDLNGQQPAEVVEFTSEHREPDSASCCAGVKAAALRLHERDDYFR
jgi:hypothetical protein